MKMKYLILIFIPAIFIAGTALAIRIFQYAPLRPSEEEIKKSIEQTKSIPILSDDPYIGNKKADITIIAFEDPGCEGCAASFNLAKDLINKYPNKIKFVFKMIPVTKFPYSTEKTIQNIYCAHGQNKLQTFSDLVFTNYNTLSDSIVELLIDEAELNRSQLDTCLKSGRAAQYLARNVALGTLLNTQSVPTFFYNNKQIKTPQIIEEWEAILGL